MMNKLWFFLVLLFALASVIQGAIAKPRFSFPVDCELGKTCWLVKYVDVAPEIGKERDYRCGPHTHDNHKGTDIAVKDMVAMEQGVAVKAAENGTVVRILENVDDIMPDAEDLLRITKNRTACGNGVFIDHGEGWQSVYCHMKKNSIRVKEGEDVRRGQKIGKLGHSGLAEYPHLHFGVFYNRKTIDPFTGYSDTEGCGKKGKDLWRSDNLLKTYLPPAIMAAGFSADIPNFDSVRIDSYSPPEFKKLKKSLFFWASYYGARKNDIIVMEIYAPDGSIFAKKMHKQDTSRARQFYYIGRKIKLKSLKPGLYEGVITITRLDNGKKIIRDVKRGVYIRE